MTWLTSSLLHVIANPLPLYLVPSPMAGYNLLFKLNQRDPASGEGNVERNIFWQIAFDLTALTLLLYFTDLPRNPFLFFFVFHMIIAGMYLRGSTPYYFAAYSTGLVGIVLLLEYYDKIHRFTLNLPSDIAGAPPLVLLYLLVLFAAFASALWFTVILQSSIRRYVDLAH